MLRLLGSKAQGLQIYQPCPRALEQALPLSSLLSRVLLCGTERQPHGGGSQHGGEGQTLMQRVLLRGQLRKHPQEVWAPQLNFPFCLLLFKLDLIGEQIK